MAASWTTSRAANSRRGKSSSPRSRKRPDMTATPTAAGQGLPAGKSLHIRRLLRAMLPALSLALVLGGIAYLNPRAISYFGFTLMLNLAIPIALATIAQMFVITGNDLDLS